MMVRTLCLILVIGLRHRIAICAEAQTHLERLESGGQSIE
jgi:hypothetical protein